MNLSLRRFFDGVHPYAPSLLRIAVALVFLWFGINQLIFPDNFIGYLPSWTFQDQAGMGHMMYTGISRIGFLPPQLLFINGMFEVVFGLLLICGIFTRMSALLLGVHLLGITFLLGYNEIAVRDFGLALATLSVFLAGPDGLCWDKKYR